MNIVFKSEDKKFIFEMAILGTVDFKQNEIIWLNIDNDDSDVSKALRVIKTEKYFKKIHFDIWAKDIYTLHVIVREER